VTKTLSMTYVRAMMRQLSNAPADNYTTGDLPKILISHDDIPKGQLIGNVQEG
jgi:hypothetical protein